MSAGQVWRRGDGLRWVEVQTAAVDPAGWCLMVPLVGLDEAADAPPLVVTIGQGRARVHLVTSTAQDRLGEPDGELSHDDLADLQAAVRAMVTDR